MVILAYLVTGLAAGVLGGMFGVGGGIIIVPALVYFGGFTQQRAQGTSLACLLAPIGILGVMEYAKSKMIDLPAAGFVALGFLLGAFGGSKIAIGLDEALMRRSFAVFLIMVAIYLLVKK